MTYRRPTPPPCPVVPAPPGPSRAQRLAWSAIGGTAHALSGACYVLGWAYAVCLWIWDRAARPARTLLARGLAAWLCAGGGRRGR